MYVLFFYENCLLRTRSLRVHRQCCKAWRIPAVLLKLLARIFHGVLELHIPWIEVVNSSQFSSIAELRLVKKPNVVFLFVQLLSTFLSELLAQKQSRLDGACTLVNPEVRGFRVFSSVSFCGEPRTLVPQAQQLYSASAVTAHQSSTKFCPSKS